jgi:hypothetical protein
MGIFSPNAGAFVNQRSGRLATRKLGPNQRRLGSLDGVETGVRQLRRAKPLETTVIQVGAWPLTLPTLTECRTSSEFGKAT